jgi:hypothetical protein
MFFSLDLNRKNINRAISDNMLREFGMHMSRDDELNYSQNVGINTNDFNHDETVSMVLANMGRIH